MLSVSSDPDWLLNQASTAVVSLKCRDVISNNLFHSQNECLCNSKQIPYAMCACMRFVTPGDTVFIPSTILLRSPYVSQEANSHLSYLGDSFQESATDVTHVFIKKINIFKPLKPSGCITYQHVQHSKIQRSADTLLYVFGTDLKIVTISLYTIN